MKNILAGLILPLLIMMTSGCSNLDFAGASGSGVTNTGEGAPEYVDTGSANQAALRQQRLSAMVQSWESQRQGLGNQDYIVGQDDVLDFSVFALENPDEASIFTREVTKEGTVDLPLVGNLHVEGLSAAQIKKAVSDVYNEKFIRNPRVSVTVKEYKSAPVVISGAVNAPGVYFLTHNSSTVLELLSMANGLTDEASSELKIVRSKSFGSPPPTTGSQVTSAPKVSGEAPEDTGEVYDFSVFEGPIDGPQIADGVTNGIIQSEAGTPDGDVLQDDDSKSKRGFFGRKKKIADETTGTGDGEDGPQVDHSIIVEVDGIIITNIASATEDPDPEAMLVDDTTETIIVDLDRLVDNGDLSQNVTITGGDVVTVPTRKSEHVYIMGYVANPGKIEIEKGKRVRELWAIAQVGGLSPSARPQNCVLIRERNLNRVPVDLRAIAKGIDPPLYMEAGDTLIVGSSSMMKIVEYIKPSVGAGVSASPIP